MARAPPFCKNSLQDMDPFSKENIFHCFNFFWKREKCIKNVSFFIKKCSEFLLDRETKFNFALNGKGKVF